MSSATTARCSSAFAPSGKGGERGRGHVFRGGDMHTGLHGQPLVLGKGLHAGSAKHAVEQLQGAAVFHDLADVEGRVGNDVAQHDATTGA